MNCGRQNRAKHLTFGRRPLRKINAKRRRLMDWREGGGRGEGEEGGFTFSSSPTLKALVPEERGIVWPSLAAADRAAVLDVAFLAAAIAIAAGTLPRCRRNLCFLSRRL
jgi:hypothetical protein